MFLKFKLKNHIQLVTSIFRKKYWDLRVYVELPYAYIINKDTIIYSKLYHLSWKLLKKVFSTPSCFYFYKSIQNGHLLLEKVYVYKVSEFYLLFWYRSHPPTFQEKSLKQRRNYLCRCDITPFFLIFDLITMIISSIEILSNDNNNK